MTELTRRDALKALLALPALPALAGGAPEWTPPDAEHVTWRYTAYHNTFGHYRECERWVKVPREQAYVLLGRNLEHTRAWGWVKIREQAYRPRTGQDPAGWKQLPTVIIDHSHAIRETIQTTPVVYTPLPRKNVLL